MFTWLTKKTLFLKTIIVTVITQFVYTSIPAYAYEKLDHLRPPAVITRDGGQDVTGNIAKAILDGGQTRKIEAIHVLSNTVSLLEGAMTGGYNVFHAVTDNSDGVLINHSEPRGRLEKSMSLLLERMLGLHAKGVAPEKIEQEYMDSLKTLANMDINAKDFNPQNKEKILAILKDLVYRSNQGNADMVIETLSRSIVNKIMNMQLKEVIAYAKKYGYTFKETVLCIGETRAQYEAKRTQEVLEQDAREILEDISNEDAKLIGLRNAYEPRWAINTGLIPDPIHEIEPTHEFIMEKTGKILGEALDVDYGGSLNKKNAKEILPLKHVSGGLIGGASKTTDDIGPVIDEAIRLADIKGKPLHIGMNWKAENKRTNLMPVEAFVEYLKKKDLSKVQITISTPNVKDAKPKIIDLERYLAKTSPIVEGLISRLEKSKKDQAQRAAVLKEIAGIGKGMADFLDLFLIKEKGRLDAEQLSALRSRMFKELYSSLAPKRVGILGYDAVARLALRDIVSGDYDNLELVTIASKAAPEDLFPFIKRDSQQGVFDGPAKRAGDFFYLGQQEEAIKVISTEKNLINIVDSMPWDALALDVVIIDEDTYKKLGKDGIAKLQAKNIQVIVSRASGNGLITYVPGLSDEKEVQKQIGISVAPAQQTAVVLGVQALAELGGGVNWVDPHVVESFNDQTLPTHRIPGALQVSHTEEKRFNDILVSKLGLKTEQISPATVIKTAISHGQLVELTVGLSRKVTKEDVVNHFKNVIKKTGLLALPEDGVRLTSNLIWGEKPIFFSDSDVYVKEYAGGTAVKVLFFIDEDTAHVSHIIDAIAQRSSAKEAGAQGSAEEEFAKSDVLDSLKKAKKAKEDVAEVKKAAETAARVGLIEDAKNQISVQSGTDAKVASIDILKEASQLLFSESGLPTAVSVLRQANGQAAGVAVVKGNKIVSASLLSAPSLEETQSTLTTYYSALRDYALSLSAKNNNADIEVTDVYKPEEKLRVNFVVSAKDPRKTIYKSVEQSIKDKWVVLSEPNTEIDPADFEGKYVVSINGAGGRIGSLWVREASSMAKKNLRIIAMGGPEAERLGEFMKKGDYVQGPFKGEIKYGTDWVEINGKRSIVFSSKAAQTFRDPVNYPWGTFIFAGVPVNVAVDATGEFTTPEELNAHRQAGALRVALTAPGDGKAFENSTFVMNINQENYDPDSNYFVSGASCTTGCLAILNRLVEIALAKKKGLINKKEYAKASEAMKYLMINNALTKNIKLPGLMTTFHALTEEKLSGDRVTAAKKSTRKRNAMDNIIPTTTGAAKAIGLVDLVSTKLDGLAVRLPVDVGSMVTNDYILEGTYTKEDFLYALKDVVEVARGVSDADVDYSGQIKLVDEFRTMMSTISPNKIQVINFINSEGKPMTMVKVSGWYENELYYARESVDFVNYVMRKKENQPVVNMNDDGRLVPVKAAISGLVTYSNKELKEFKSPDDKPVYVTLNTDVGDIEGGIVSDKQDKKLIEGFDYLEALSGKNALYILGHNGRPSGKYAEKLGLFGIAKWYAFQRAKINGKGIEEHIGKKDVSGRFTEASYWIIKDYRGKGDVKVWFLPDNDEASINRDAQIVKDLKPGDWAVAENRRMDPREQAGDPAGDNPKADPALRDAAIKTMLYRGGEQLLVGPIGFNFGTADAHRFDARITEAGKYLLLATGPNVAEFMGKINKVKASIEEAHKKGSVAFVVSGLKKDKIELLLKAINNVLLKGDKVIVVGAINAYPLAAEGKTTGKMEIKKDALEMWKEVVQAAKAKDIDIYYPKALKVVKDLTTAKKEDILVIKDGNIPDGYVIGDVDDNALTEIFKILEDEKIKLVLQSGPIGPFDLNKLLADGSDKFQQKLAKLLAEKISIGSDTQKANKKAGVEGKFPNQYTEGGAFLEGLTTPPGQDVPAVMALKKSFELHKAIPSDSGSGIKNIIARIKQKFNISEEKIKNYFRAEGAIFQATGGKSLSEFINTVQKTLPEYKEKLNGDLTKAVLSGQKIADSRGRPTVRAVLKIGDVEAIGEVPAGESKGEDEANTVDTDQAIRNINEIILPMLQKSGLDLSKYEDMRKAEKMIVEAAGANFITLGANAVVPVSWALWKMSAKLNNMPLWEYIRTNEPEAVGEDGVDPFMNVGNGGKHAAKGKEVLGVDRIAIQEIMIVPSYTGTTHRQRLEMGDKIDQALKKVLEANHEAATITRADEAGFSVKGLGDSRKAINYIVQAIKNAGYKPGKDVKLALDSAATSFYNKEKGVYEFEGKELTSAQLVEYYKNLADDYLKEYPESNGLIKSIEDGMHENDWDNWVKFTAEMSKRGVITIGDDLFVTQMMRLKKGIELNAATAILIKVNQNGSLGDTLEVIKFARKHGLKIVVSHRSGETLSPDIADLAYAINAWGLKTGDSQPEVDFKDKNSWVRRNKYLRLVEIQEKEDAQEKALIIGPSFFKAAGVSNALNEVAKLSKVVNIVLYGADAEKIKVLLGNKDIITGKTLNGVISKLGELGVKSDNMLLLRSAGETLEAAAVKKLNELKVKQVVTSEIGTLTLAKATKELINTPEANKAFGEFVAATAKEGVISETAYANSKEALLAQLEAGKVFEFSKELVVTQKVAADIKQDTLAAVEFMGKI